MTTKYPTLLSPIKIGNITFNSRIFSPPMGHPGITSDGVYTPDAIAYYEYRAKGGVASVCCTEGIVHPSGKSHTRMIDLTNEFVLSSLTQAARAIKKHGAVANIEINHGGKYSDIDQLDKSIATRNKRYGPSAATLANGAEIAEMPIEFIKELVESFGKGAALCKRAGFDMILLHAGHGWLIHQFINPAENQRTDEYGGSLENRSRLLLEVLASIRKAVGPGFPIEVRISANDYMEGGSSFEETIEIAKLIDGKCDLIHVSNGSHEGTFDKVHPSMFDPRGINVHWAAEIKKHVKTPVATLGALNDPVMMEEIIASGQADVVEIGRATVADPFFVRKIKTGRENEIRKCTRCYQCLAERVHTQTRICAINPVIGRELENLQAFPPTDPKKILVAGGGPGGLQAAVKAAERGHDVTLYEKSDSLGGALKSERKVDFKSDFFGLAQTLKAEADRVGVKILLNTELTSEIAKAEKADIVIAAVGAEAIMPPLPGIDRQNVISANRLSDDDIIVGNKIAILGGGLVGCEAAIHLAQEGKDVTIVEMLDGIARDLNGLQTPVMLHKMDEVGIKVLVSTKALEINDTGLKIEAADGTQSVLEADTIFIAVGQRPKVEAVDKLRDAAPIVEVVGDCFQPGKITDALVRGWYAGIDA